MAVYLLSNIATCKIRYGLLSNSLFYIITNSLQTFNELWLYRSSFRGSLKFGIKEFCCCYDVVRYLPVIILLSIQLRTYSLY